MRDKKWRKKEIFSSKSKKEDCATTTFASRCFLIIGTYSIDHVQSTVLQPQFVAAFPSQSYALVFYSLLFLALLEVRTYSRKTTSIDWRDSRRVIFSRFLPRAMVASTVFEADSARCLNALGRANIATRQVFSNVQKFKDWIQKC